MICFQIKKGRKGNIISIYAIILRFSLIRYSFKRDISNVANTFTSIMFFCMIELCFIFNLHNRLNQQKKWNKERRRTKKWLNGNVLLLCNSQFDFRRWMKCKRLQWRFLFNDNSMKMQLNGEKNVLAAKLLHSCTSKKKFFNFIRKYSSICLVLRHKIPLFSFLFLFIIILIFLIFVAAFAFLLTSYFGYNFFFSPLFTLFNCRFASHILFSFFSFFGVLFVSRKNRD